jgi:hypothetical protein
MTPYGNKTQPSYKWAKQLSLSFTAESLCQFQSSERDAFAGRPSILTLRRKLFLHSKCL